MTAITQAIDLSAPRIGAGLSGAALVGACLGLQGGASAGLIIALALPAIWIGVAALTAPALYIGSAFIGVAPTPAHTLKALARGLADMGLVMLGLAPALLFLTATSGSPLVGLLIVYGVIALSGCMGLWMIYPRLFDGIRAADEDVIRWRSRTLWAIWSVICLGIGHHLLSRALEATF